MLDYITKRNQLNVPDISRLQHIFYKRILKDIAKPSYIMEGTKISGGLELKIIGETDFKLEWEMNEDN